MLAGLIHEHIGVQAAAAQAWQKMTPNRQRSVLADLEHRVTRLRAGQL